MAKKRWLIAILALLLLAGFAGGCDGKVYIAEDPNPDSNRVVLVETFVQSKGKLSPAAAEDLETIASAYGPSKMILVEYYLTSDYVVDSGNKRADEYGVTNLPFVCFNGLQNHFESKKSLDEYKEQVDAERAKDTSIVITAQKSFSEDKMIVDTAIRNGGTTELKDIGVWFVIYQDRGMPGKHCLVREIASGPPTRFGSLAAGATEKFSYNFDVTKISDTSKLEAVVLLQSTDTSAREVLQAALAVAK